MRLNEPHEMRHSGESYRLDRCIRKTSSFELALVIARVPKNRPNTVSKTNLRCAYLSELEHFGNSVHLSTTSRY
jgi:hypothetical protein